MRPFDSYSKADLKAHWRNAWDLSSFGIQFFVSIATLLVITIFIDGFFNYIQARPDENIEDGILNSLTPHDMSLYIFLFIYPVIILSVLHLIFDPPLLLKLLMAYCLLLILRMCTLYFTSLEAPASIIPLEDIFSTAKMLSQRTFSFRVIFLLCFCFF